MAADGDAVGKARDAHAERPQQAGKNDGKLKKLGDLRIVSQDGDYKLIYAVLAVCALAIVAALFVSSIAYYGLWVLAIGTFLLAVYYTVKIM